MSRDRVGEHGPLPQEIIRRKRDGGSLSEEEISFFVEGLVAGRITDAQAAALAMAVFFRDMSRAECVALTTAMTRSGTVLDWSAQNLPGPVLDKHSTGGVGDAVSLVLAPAVAACGGFVPMISGRGLGHTGGTLDKLESIPGYDAAPDPARFRETVRRAGCAIIGQTEDLAPADRRLYAVRDVTATVESIPLITASILSKKLAAGLHGLVLDVKTGNGAFMARREDAERLAESLVAVAGGAGLPTVALLTDMSRPLARAAGNALEVRAAIDHLTGRQVDERLHEVTVALAGEMLQLGGLVDGAAAGRDRIEVAIGSGQAAERFARMVAALGGPADLLERPDAHLPRAPVVRPVPPARSGLVIDIDTRRIGLAVVALGGGRTRPEDPVDHAVGFTDLAGLGETVGPERPLGTVHARSEADAEAAARALRDAYRVSDKAASVAPPALIQARIAP